MSSFFHVNVDRQLDIVNHCKLQELVGSAVMVISAGSHCTFATAGSLRFRAVVYYLFLNDPEGFSSFFFFFFNYSFTPFPPPLLLIPLPSTQIVLELKILWFYQLSCDNVLNWKMKFQGVNFLPFPLSKGYCSKHPF